MHSDSTPLGMDSTTLSSNWPTSRSRLGRASGRGSKRRSAAAPSTMSSGPSENCLLCASRATKPSRTITSSRRSVVALSSSAAAAMSVRRALPPSDITRSTRMARSTVDVLPPGRWFTTALGRALEGVGGMACVSLDET